MKKIENPITKITVSESSETAIDLSVAILEKGVDDAFLTKQAQELGSKGKEMNISIASDRGGENTEELIALDENRDAYHNALKLFIRGFMALPTDDKTGKAAEVYQLLKQHGLAMDRESYSVQSNLTTSLLNELAKPEMVSIISDLNLTDLITQYTGSEETFKSKYRESISAEASKEKLVAASSIKKEVHQLQKQTIGYLNAMLVAQPEKYKDVAAVVAEIMEKINQKIRNRYNKN